jgi:peptide/nickel transport system substrate-binding protein
MPNHEIVTSSARRRSPARGAVPVVALLTSLAILLTACQPGGSTPRPSEGVGAGSTGPKTLIMGLTTSEGEPAAGGFAYGASSTGRGESFYLLHAGLTLYDGDGNVQPRVVERIPTIENGDWRLLPDGRMEVTWRLRPDFVWHDGAPLVADDIVLGFKAGVDPELFDRGTRILRQIGEVTALDPKTVVMHWRNTYVFANDLALETIVPLPQHRMGALYESGNKEAFASSPLLTDEWVGLGPYRLREWQRGSIIDLQAFDQYALGRPKIDRMILRLVGDTNALVVRMTAGEIHLVPVGVVGEGEAFILKNQLEPSGAGRVLTPNIALVVGDWQLKDPALPWTQDPRIRLALVKLLDRQSMVDTVLNGLAEVGDLLISPTDPAYQVTKSRALPNTSYDPNEAHRILAGAGWTRDASGMYRRGGEPFPLTVLASGDVYTRVQLVLAMAGQWKAAGIDAREQLQPGTLDSTTRGEERAKVAGVYYGRQRYAAGLSNNYRTNELATEANRWRGSNTGGYSNPVYDDLRDRFERTLPRPERDQIVADMSKLLLDDMVYLPTVTNSETIAVRKELRGVTNISGEILRTAWNAHEWDMN